MHGDGRAKCSRDEHNRSDEEIDATIHENAIEIKCAAEDQCICHLHIVSCCLRAVHFPYSFGWPPENRIAAAGCYQRSQIIHATDQSKTLLTRPIPHHAKITSDVD